MRKDRLYVMSQSLVLNYIHVVFTTKNREAFLREEVAKGLYRYLAGICTNHHCNAVTIGGAEDHVHILCSLSKKISLVVLMEHLKSHSSKWMKVRFPRLQNFAWQNGYGAFSVETKSVDDLRHYIANQREHHKRVSFQEEYRHMLEVAQVKFDERYVWD